MNAIRTLRFAPVSLAMLVAACGGSEPPPAPPPPPPPASAAPPAPTPAPTPTAETPPPPPEPTLPDVAFGPTTPSDQPKPMPKVAIKAPLANASIPADKAKDYEVKLDVKNWDTHMGGPHVHLILDNHPYKPIYDTKAPVKLGDLVGPSDTLAEGEHLLVAFPSRQNHESVKGQGALAITHFWIGKKGKSEWKPTDPMLIYSRPKGTYNGAAADHVLVDWYLANVELGDGKDQIKATVKGPGLDEAGRTVTIKEWRPYVLDNLRSGDYTISMQLEDKDGKPVPGAWNSTTRTITVNREAPNDTPPAPPAAEEKKSDATKDGAKPEAKKAEAPKGDAKTPEAKPAPAKPTK